MTEKFHNIDAAGRAVVSSPEQVADAVRGGFGYKAIPGEVAQALANAERDSKYVDENWGTTGKVAMGVADGATLGLGPALATKLGILDNEHLQAAQQSGSYMAGEAAGFLVPALATGGESAIARALAATPAGMVGHVGGLAEAAVGRLLPEAGILGKVGTSAVKMAARGGSENALMNVAHQASQDIIANKPLSAQAMLAAGYDGALFGALLGAPLGAAAGAIGHGGEALMSRGAQAVGGSGERAAGLALKRVGVDAADVAAKEGGAVGAVKEISDLMKRGETSFAAPTAKIRERMVAVAEDMDKTARAALQDLGKVGKPPVGTMQELANAFSEDWNVMYRGTANAAKANTMYKAIVKDLKSASEWEHWAKNRDILATRTASAPEGSLKRAVHESALQKFDEAFRAAGEKVDPAIFQQYASAVTQKNLAQTLVESTGEKLGQEASRGNPLALNQADGGQLAIGTILGNPIGAVGVVASRKIAAYAQDRLEPVIAEYAARSAIGAKAGAATAEAGSRITNALKKFMGLAPKGAGYAHSQATAPKLSYTIKAYNEAVDLADKLTSQAHQERVREYLSELSLAGHPELAKQMGMAYGRAVADINHNRPKETIRDKQGGSLGRLPKQMGLDDKDMKFMRRLHSMRDPVGTIVNGLEKGNLSMDAVASIKYVMPDLHKELVTRASFVASEMKQAGKFLPADKLSMLGCALDYAVDTTLRPEFINEVQQGLAANQKPQGQPSGGPSHITDTSAYQTPLQSAV